MAIEQLLTQLAMHVDEISLRVEKRNHCIHGCSGGEIHPDRAGKSAEENQNRALMVRYISRPSES